MNGGLQTALEKKKKKKLQPWEEYETDQPVRRLTREEVSASVNAPPTPAPPVVTSSEEAYNKAEALKNRTEKVRTLTQPVTKAGEELLDLMVRKKAKKKAPPGF